MKKSVLVVFGGQSSEHIVSCMSAINVIKNIDTERYDVTLIGITEEGKWLLVDSVEQIEDELEKEHDDSDPFPGCNGEIRDRPERW